MAPCGCRDWNVSNEGSAATSTRGNAGLSVSRSARDWRRYLKTIFVFRPCSTANRAADPFSSQACLISESFNAKGYQLCFRFQNSIHRCDADSAGVRNF